MCFDFLQLKFVSTFFARKHACDVVTLLSLLVHLVRIHLVGFGERCGTEGGREGWSKMACDEV